MSSKPTAAVSCPIPSTLGLTEDRSTSTVIFGHRGDFLLHSSCFTLKYRTPRCEGWSRFTRGSQGWGGGGLFHSCCKISYEHTHTLLRTYSV